MGWILDATGQRVARCQTNGTKIVIFPADGSNFALGTDNVFIQGEITFETT